MYKHASPYYTFIVNERKRLLLEDLRAEMGEFTEAEEKNLELTMESI